MKIRVLIVEDDKLFAWSLENMFDNLGRFEVISVFDNAEEAVVFLKANPYSVDVLIIDLILKGKMRGYDIIDKLPAIGIHVVFITGWDDESIYRGLIKNLKCSYLVKPFHKFTLDSTIRVLMESSSQENVSDNDDDSRFYIRLGAKQEVVNSLKIDWIESSRNYCTIHNDNKIYTIKRSLKNVFSLLPEGKFIFIHKSYIVRINLIKKINIKDQFIWIGEKKFPLGRTYFKRVQEIFTQMG